MNIVSTFFPKFLAPTSPATKDDYIGMLRLLDASCSKLGLRHVVITDGTIGLPFSSFAPPIPNSLMKATLAGQLAYLRSASFNANTVMVDADCLVQKDPSVVFDGSFDLGLTARRWGKEERREGDEDSSAINNGAMFCPIASRFQVAYFFQRALEICQDHWGADQEAIARIATPIPKREGIYMRVGARVRFFPVKGYNEAPRAADYAISKDAYVVHFRGPRKSYMKSYYEQMIG